MLTAFLERIRNRKLGPAPIPSPRLLVTKKSERFPFFTEIGEASVRYRIPRPLIAAVIKCESNWDPRARSRKGARGLMQVLPRTAERVFGVPPERLWDPATNIRVGTAYLRVLAGRYPNNTYDVVAAYNAGPTRVDRRAGLPRETRAYRLCVKSWHARYAKTIG